MKKLLLTGLAIASFGMILPSAANATCTITGEVFRVIDTATGTTAYIKAVPLSGVYYIATSLDSDLRDALRSCENSGHRCAVIGSIASCPAGGSIGTATTVYANP